MIGPEPVSPCCRADLRTTCEGSLCIACGRKFPRITQDIVDLRLTSARRAEGLHQEPIWDRASEGFPTTPVDGLECRNDLKSILFRTLSDRIGWPGRGTLTVDLGCFDGSLSRNWTFRYGTKIIGVDASLRAIQRARSAEPFSNEYHLAVLEALPFRDGTFDAALSLDVMEHLGDPRPAIREAARVLKPDAVFLFYVVSSRAVLTLDWWRYHLRRLSGKPVPRRFGDHPEGGHWVENLVDPRSFSLYCREAGLEVDGLHPFHSFFTAFLDDLVRPLIVGRRASIGTAETPPAVVQEGRQAVLPSDRISPAKRRRLAWVKRAFDVSLCLDAPWRAALLGRGFAAWGRRRSV